MLPHSVSLGLTWPHSRHLVSFGDTKSRVASFVFTCTHLGSCGFTWSHLVSLGLTWPRLVSLGLNWTHMFPIGKRETPARQKRKGKPADGNLKPVLTLHPERAHARTNRNRNRFPGWTHPPTSDMDNTILTFLLKVHK